MLYGLHTSRQADFHIALQIIEADLQPNLLLDEPENATEMKAFAEQAKAIFKEQAGNGFIEFSAHTHPRIQKAVLNGLDYYKQALKKDLHHFSKEMKKEVDKVFYLYLQGLSLILALADATEEETRRIRKVYPDKPILASQLNFTHNPFLNALRSSESFREQSLRYHAGWEKDQELVWSWYKEVFKKNEDIHAYLKKAEPDDATHKEILWTIGRDILLKAPGIQAWFESEDLNWAENKDIVKGMLKKSLKDVEKEGFELLELSVNWEEDQEFFETLFLKTDISDARLEQYFASALKNWDLERITTTDRILLSMALTEMLEFPSIPVKVSINEYIEISKQYSTPKSKQFVNGLLDAVSSDMIQKGLIRKSGRGLIDNK